MKPILISGFEPFANYTTNSSLEIIRAMEGTILPCGSPVRTCVLPVVRNDCATELLQLIDEVHPVAVIALGQSSRPLISIERVAINIDDYPIADNAGNCPVDETIVEGAPAAYWSSLPVKDIVRRLRDAEIESEVSNSAGTYVCNHLFYQLQHAAKAQRIITGFVHLPVLPEASNTSVQLKYSFDKMLRAVSLMAEVCCVHATALRQ